MTLASGPWSEPVNLQIDGIDPSHIMDDKGQRWVFMNDGYRAKLNPNGLAVEPGTLEKVYDGWDFPLEWESDGFNL
jgi:beta-xylosidase